MEQHIDTIRYWTPLDYFTEKALLEVAECRKIVGWQDSQNWECPQHKRGSAYVEAKYPDKAVAGHRCSACSMIECHEWKARGMSPPTVPYPEHPDADPEESKRMERGVAAFARAKDVKRRTEEIEAEDRWAMAFNELCGDGVIRPVLIHPYKVTQITQPEANIDAVKFGLDHKTPAKGTVVVQDGQTIHIHESIGRVLEALGAMYSACHNYVMHLLVIPVADYDWDVNYSPDFTRTHGEKYQSRLD